MTILSGVIFVERDVLLLCGLCFLLLTLGCTSPGHFPKTVEAELIAAVVEHNGQVRGWSGPYVDDISEVSIVSAARADEGDIENHLSHVDQMWCATAKVSGLKEGALTSYEMEWFAIRGQGSQEWDFFPRHLVSYPYIYDQLCEPAAP